MVQIFFVLYRIYKVNCLQVNKELKVNVLGVDEGIDVFLKQLFFL